jgi:pimeloyl-ACP methyl ester carboxylesterase
MRRTLALFAALALAPALRAQEKTFDSNGVKIAYLDEGKGDVVVLLHGFGASAGEMWKNMPFVPVQVMPELAKEFRVVATDQRGHGKSDKPHDPKKYGREMADDVVRLLDHLKVKKAHVVGYSMGAMVAGKLLVAHPDRLLSVTFGGAGPMCQVPKEFTAVVDATAASLAQGKGIGPLVISLTPEGQKPPTAEEAAALSGLFLGGKDQKALAAVLRGFPDLEVTEQELKAVRVPVRFVYGSLDPLKEMAVRTGKLIPKSDAVVIDKGDHITALTSPQFRKAVVEFLKANKP